jgi:hypothetical protein
MPADGAKRVDAAPGRQRLMTKHWKWLCALLVFELWLLYSIPSQVLTTFPGLKAVILAMAQVAPVITNLAPLARAPEALSLYFAITLILIVPKSVFFYLWLNSSLRGNYRHLVISPLTARTPKRPTDFVLQPLKTGGEDDEVARSMASRIGWSIGIALLSAGALFYLLRFGFEVAGSSPHSAPTKYLLLAQGGWRLWLGWSLTRTMCYALIFAIFACVMRDVFAFVVQPSLQKEKAHE